MQDNLEAWVVCNDEGVNIAGIEVHDWEVEHCNTECLLSFEITKAQILI